jgi:hypothetical protein
MSELARKFIYAAAAGDAQESQMAFEAAAAEKMIAALDAKRAQVARDMFKEATRVDNEVALDAMRQQDVEEGASEKDGTFLEEQVSDHDVSSDIEHHSYLHGSYEKSQPGHGKRVVDHEQRILKMHGPTALAHIKQHTNLMQKYNEMEQNSKSPMTPEDYQKSFGRPLTTLRQNAVKASHNFQMGKE